MSESQYTILDKQENRDGEVESYLIHWKESGRTERKAGNAKNRLLFEEELFDFINGESAVRLSEDPDVVVQSRSDEYSFLLRYNDDVVETMPSQAKNVLEAISDAIDGDVSTIKEVYTDIRENHVRKDLINALRSIFGSDASRIEMVGNGWLIDGFFLITWNAELYSTERGPEENSLTRRGDKIVEADSNNEFVDLDLTEDIESEEVTVDGTEYLLTEREMLFLMKAEWVLDGPKYHPNKEYWMHLHLNHTDLDVDV